MSAPALIEPLPQHRIDADALFARLAADLPDFVGPATLRQFQGGQSNPTYLITTPSKRFVLRKKPPGKLLPSAHQIDREFRIISALAQTDVPVAPARLFCEDETVIGTSFYVMDYVEGRIFPDTTLRDAPQEQRRPIYFELAETLASLHAVDPDAVGLSDLGRPDNYVGRQIDRWGKQYLAAKTEEIPAMDRLMAWLPENRPQGDETAVVHGDFRLGNMIYDPDRPKILAVLDWELGTLGHPLSDLAYCALAFHQQGRGPLPGMADVDLDREGLPHEREFLEAYARASGRTEIPDWRFFLALSLFRLVGITQGVYARSLAGNAADPSAAQMGEVAKASAIMGWEIASGARRVA